MRWLTGPEARELLAGAGAAGCSSLRQLCTRQPSIEQPGGRLLTLLSEQTHRVGAGSVSAYLFQSTCAASCLTPQQVCVFLGCR